MAEKCTTWEEARDKLRKFREDQLRKSDEVLELWREILSDLRYKLGSEKWAVYEQVCIAACDCGDIDIAQQCHSALDVQFPHSIRVGYLNGLILEASSNYDEALELYTSLLKRDETNMLISKRVASVYRAQNKIPEAIKELTDHLQKFISDFEAWMELCELYLIEMDYSKAAYCMEELLLSNPYNHIYHQKYAEIRYTQGGQENMEISKKYFAQALKLNPLNIRALFGLYMTSCNLAQKSAAIKSKKDRHIECAKVSLQNLEEHYKTCYIEEETQSDASQFLSIMFDSLTFNPTP